MTKQQYLLLISLGLGALIGALNGTMFNVALPIMMDVFQVSLPSVQWLTSGYMLAAGMIIPAAGFLGDRIGYKKIFCGALCAIFILSVIGAAAWCIEVLIVVRFAFGLAGGLLSPLSLAMLYQYMPVNQQAKAASVWGMTATMGGILSTCLSGFILSIASWRFLLLFNIPFVAIALWMCIKILPEDQERSVENLDFLGLVLTGAGSFLFLLTFSNLSAWGVSFKLFGCLAAGVLCLVFYFARSWNKSDVLLNLNVLKYRRYLAAFLASGINVIAICMITFLMPLFLQTGLGVSPAVTGLVMLPGAIASIIAMSVTGSVFAKIGEKTAAILGIGIIVLGSIPFMFATPASAVLFITAAQCVRCCGLGVLNLVATNAQMSAIPPNLSGHASALTNWLHQMLNALTVGLAGSMVDWRISGIDMSADNALAWAYTSTTNVMMVLSCILLFMVIPIALKFFRSKKEC